MSLSTSPFIRPLGADSNALAADPTALNALKTHAGKDQRAAIKQVASQFEALFLDTLVKQMRTTSLDGEEKSSDMDTYQGLFDQQLVQNLTQAGGVGLGEVLAKQIGKLAGVTEKDIAGHTVDLAPLPPVSSGTYHSAQANVADRLQALALHASANLDALSGNGGGGGLGGGGTAVSTDAREFVKAVLPDARQAAQTLGVAPALVVAHAALESGWGKRAIRHADGRDSHNLFGIKASSDWNGPTVDVLTTEYVNGAPQKKVARFRSYSSYAESLTDYAKLLSNNPRYKAVLGQGQNLQGFAQGLQNAGYATDPRYAKKLTDVASALLSRGSGS
ncbi:flagellar assembly peptidoglycan hydrolase FlgJ [Crenobacter sp. SG2303]|uniref:Peptidoglycan hydrolase FlgJ n=1 Tax=Crenobacter oryzisoli TaxID=3056844 RepID=A0ABT7XKF8_9NEIS|nr:flagellar assembly peptidoglycan hydrolase FlgJ [Crenobacter sp. SG2303]MDN0074265.1 flagellar assembly peptidoglycan hydrolase FlgJ [Crenobacter sp. SG2303]